MAYDERLATRIRKVLARRKGFTEKKMFGGMGFFLGGKGTGRSYLAESPRRSKFTTIILYGTTSGSRLQYLREPSFHVRPTGNGFMQVSLNKS